MFWSNIFIMWKRETRGYFYTPLAYVFIGMFTLLMGVMFSNFLAIYWDYTQRSMMGMAPSITIDRLAEAFYNNMHLILMFTLPFFTMRLFTEESRQNTLALLMTSPVRNLEIVLAKFFSASTILLIQLSITLVFPLFLIFYSQEGSASAGPDLGIIFSTYLGLLLACLAYISFGLFWSSVTESQLVAVVLTFAANFTTWLFTYWAQGSASDLQALFQHLSFPDQFGVFAKGVLELRSIVYFLSVIVLGLFLTNRSLESRAWRS